MAKEQQSDIEAMLSMVKRLEADIRAGTIKGLAYVEIYADNRLNPGVVGMAAGYPELAMGAAFRLGYFANHLLDEDEASARKAQD